MPIIMATRRRYRQCKSNTTANVPKWLNILLKCLLDDYRPMPQRYFALLWNANTNDGNIYPDRHVGSSQQITHSCEHRHFGASRTFWLTGDSNFVEFHCRQWHWRTNRTCDMYMANSPETLARRRSSLICCLCKIKQWVLHGCRFFLATFYPWEKE